METFVSFFKKKHVVRILVLLLLYRFAEAQPGKMTGPFLLDNRAVGGLGLSTVDDQHRGWLRNIWLRLYGLYVVHDLRRAGSAQHRAIPLDADFGRHS